MRLLFCCISFFACVVSVRAQSPKAVTDYVEKYKKIAIEEMKQTGIPASVTLAQGIHESGCGCSVLAMKSNNHFGIKCHNEWTGVTYHHDDDQPQECFRVYTCPEESFKDHSDFLKNRPRYAALFKLEPTDYRGWARGLKAAGYATNPHYPEIIIKLIEDYKLNEYDKGIERPNAQVVQVADASKPKTTTPQAIQVPEASKLKTASQPTVSAEAAKPKAPVVSNQTAETSKSKAPTPVTQAIEAPQSKATATAMPEAVKEYYTTKVQLDERLINGVKAVVYKTNVPVAAVAKKYGLTIDELYSYNDMMPNVKFKDGEYLYLEKKKTETSYYQYEIAQGETMRDVAQKFGVQVLELYKRNGIGMDSEPLAGEIIVLRGTREVPIKYKGGFKKPVTDTPSSSQADVKYHKVNDSDTLYSIARQYNVPVDDLIKLNGLKDNDIKKGQTLVISSL
ncbi:MAG: LysM peptidoglycan-binding protein [Bacteroidetes bacterium]|nr:LysM peptidoglycan-binding protein [Bacteroidota bacterium]